MRSVVIVDPVHARGGMDHYCIPLATALIKQNYHVRLVTNSKRSDLMVGAEVDIRPYFGGLFAARTKVANLLSFALGALSTASFVMIKRPNTIHLHLFQYTFLELFLTALVKLSGLNIVATVHDVDSFRASKQNNVVRNTVFALMNILIVHNETSKSELLKTLPSRVNDICVIRHGNYIDVVSQFGNPNQTGVPLDNTMRLPCGLDILFFGQIKRVKGIEVLFDAVKILNESGVSFSLNVKGKPSDYSVEEIEQALEARGISNQTRLKLGYLPTGDAVISLQNADVVVLPYQRIYQSGVLLLAMSAGAIVVASDLPAMLEIIDDGVNGFTFRAGDPEHLAEVLERVAGLSIEARQRISENAFITTRDRFSWDDIATATTEVYGRIWIT
jgi:D-inositol-3-phosphate glycosyltransferase